MSIFKPKTKDVCAFFFTLKDANDNLYECECGNTRRKLSTNWTNLIQHIQISQPNYIQEIQEKKTVNAKGSIANFINPKAKKHIRLVKIRHWEKCRL